MTHIAIPEKLNGKAVDRMAKVSDEEYRGGEFHAVSSVGASARVSGEQSSEVCTMQALTLVSLVSAILF
jgi:hypothetical protein